MTLSKLIGMILAIIVFSTGILSIIAGINLLINHSEKIISIGGSISGVVLMIFGLKLFLKISDK